MKKKAKLTQVAHVPVPVLFAMRDDGTPVKVIAIAYRKKNRKKPLYLVVNDLGEATWVKAKKIRFIK
jgi:hypothetical protein